MTEVPDPASAPCRPPQEAGLRDAARAEIARALAASPCGWTPIARWADTADAANPTPCASALIERFRQQADLMALDAVALRLSGPVTFHPALGPGKGATVSLMAVDPVARDGDAAVWTDGAVRELTPGTALRPVDGSALIILVAVVRRPDWSRMFGPGA